jgi:hypothetical protein
MISCPLALSIVAPGVPELLRGVRRCGDSLKLTQILELLAEDDRLNVYAGELEVCPRGAPTTKPGSGPVTAGGQP